MLGVLTKALSFVVIIIIGYYLKKKGLFGPNDYSILSKIILNLTLPAAVIVSFAHFEMDYSLFALLGIGFALNVLVILLALFMTRRETAGAKLFYIFNMSGFNIGCFGMPFAQSFLGPSGVIALCMFDVGNSIMCTGMTYALAASTVGDAEGRREPFTVTGALKRLKGSVPFITYVTMLLLSMMDIRMPDGVNVFMQVLANANPFLCMLMIGMMFKLNLDKQSFAYIRQAYWVRYLISIVLAVFFYLKGPFAPELNKVLTAALLTPSTVIGPIFLGQLKGNVALAGVANSLSIVTSVILLTAFFTLSH